MKHRMSCPAREAGGICACAALTVWKGLRYKKLIPPPAGKAYGFDTDYWKPIRVGSNFEVPSFRPFVMRTQYPLATGISKKLYEAAVARALYDACFKVCGVGHSAVYYNSDLACAADNRLWQRSHV